MLEALKIHQLLSYYHLTLKSLGDFKNVVFLSVVKACKIFSSFSRSHQGKHFYIKRLIDLYLCRIETEKYVDLCPISNRRTGDVGLSNDGLTVPQAVPFCCAVVKPETLRV